MLLLTAKEKLLLSDPLKIMLESDGTEIDDDDVLLAFSTEVFMALGSGEVWAAAVATTGTLFFYVQLLFVSFLCILHYIFHTC